MGVAAVRWLDQARKFISDVARSASEEAQLLKLQTQLARLEEEKERQYAQAGRRAQELYRAHRIVDDELGVILKRIDEIDAALDELRAEVAKLQQRKS